MPNLFGLAGGQPQKPTRFAPIYTPRWSSGIWTNRSPLRDAATTRISEKFYGAAGDALIAGSNVEITNRLTLARRPGNSVFDTTNTYTAVKRFYDFRLFSSTSEQIDVMVDQTNALYSLYNSVKSLVWTKSAGAGQSYMQSVGNSLYFANGVDNKKWLQSLLQWTPNAQWNTATTPFLTTFLIDSNGNIQQLTATDIPVTYISVTDNVLTVTSSESLTGVLSAGMQIEFPSTMNATFLEYEVVQITAVSGDTFTANFNNDDYADAESGVFCTEVTGGSNPIGGPTLPTWSTVVPSVSNNFQGGVTQDGMVRWTNRGNPVENWGIIAPTVTLIPTIGSSQIAWQKNTFYSTPGVIIDSNGNLQQVTKAGLGGSTTPSWNATLFGTTTDGGVTWRMIQTAASLVWQPHTTYLASEALTITSVATASSGTSVYSGTITSGGSNAYAGQMFVVQGFTKAVNNGVFLCTASTLTTLTLDNPSGDVESIGATATSNPAYVVGNSTSGNCLYRTGTYTQPTLTGNVSAYLYPGNTYGTFTLTDPTSTGSAAASTTTQNSLLFTGNDGPAPLSWDIINGAGEVTGSNTPFPGYSEDYQLIILANLNVTVPGQYSFTVKHHDGMIFGMGNNATLVSGTQNNNFGQTTTAAEGYPVFGGTNTVGLEGGDQYYTSNFVFNCPTVGVYPMEFDYAYWYHSGQQFTVLCNGFNLANGSPASGTNAPIWPVWSTNYAPAFPSVTEVNGTITWYNVGPTSDFVWSANTNYTLPRSTIIDPNSFIQAPYRTGVSGTTAPTFAQGINQLTTDKPNLTWINQGTATSTPTGTVSTFNGGWKYCIALVNTLDDSVSNATALSQSTGNFVGANGVILAPGAGLTPSTIDPQSDYVAIFRTTDGESTPFLIPGQFTTYTTTLADYLVNGYTDTTPDTGLDNLIEAPIEDENTPPGIGAINLTYHLNRLFFSIGNTVYWTEGPDAPVGNGVNGVAPLNYDSFPSLVKRLEPTTSGLMVFTVSDVYLIPGTGTSSNPIQSGIPIMKGVGLLSYNALDVNGSVIGFFTTDNQFCIIDPSSGVSYVGFPIGDQFRLNNGTPGQSWNPANVYVTWHVNGEDQGWYVGDGTYGWYRLMPTPAPEQGNTWSPYATIVGGCGALQSIETSPGVHNLLLGPTGTGSILARDLNSSQDNGNNYGASAVIGSAVLAQPGQVAIVSFVTTESIKTGTPLSLGLLIDEALPYYTGPFETLKDWTNDPPNLTASQSIFGQRFYLAELEGEAVCRHMQIQVQWAAENAQNELLSLTIYGAFMQEN